MKRVMSAVVCSACFFATTACDTILGPSGVEPPYPGYPPLLSRPYDLLIEGKPDQNLITVKGGYYIWKLGDTWHLRAAKTDTQPGFASEHFSGSIGVEGGYITDVKTENVQPPDDMRPDPGNIFYRFGVQREMKGVDFRVKPAISEYCITFDPLINGLANPAYVRLGRGMVVADQVPITMCFRP